MKRKALIIPAVIAIAALGYVGYKPVMKAFVGTRGADGVVSCEYDGEAFESGAQRRADDGCNVCTCRANGWSCTKIFCPAGGGSSGTITGTVGYPDARIPAQRVCAINLKDSKEYCQQTVEGETSYVVPAPPGDYWIYATLIQTDTTKRAYYSEYETCGEKPECKDHSPIKITVESEKIVKADPKDWYATGQIDDLAIAPSKLEYGIHLYYPGSSFVLKSRGLASMKMFSTMWPPQNAPVPQPLGDATLNDTDHGIQTWTIPIMLGFEATTVYGVGTAENGDFMKSREMPFVRPIETGGSASSTLLKP